MPGAAQAPVFAADSPARQVALIGGMAASAFSLLALATYDAADSSLSVTTDAATQNLGGPAGAYIADALFQVFGYAAWGAGAVLVMCALRLAGRPSRGWVGAVLGGVGLLTVAAGLHIVFGTSEGAPFDPGGMIGRAVGGGVVSVAGDVGGGLIVATVLIGVSTLLFRINWQPVAARAVERVQVGAPAAARGIGSLGINAVRATVRAGAAGVEAVRARTGSYGDAPYDEVDEDEGLADDVIDGVVDGPRGAGPVAPVGGSTTPEPSSLGRLTRTTTPLAAEGGAPASAAGPRSMRSSSAAGGLFDALDSDAGAEVASVWSERRAPTGVGIAPPDDRDVPTKVAGRTLVEVEFEPTGSMPRAAAPANDLGVRAAAVAPPPPSLQRLTIPASQRAGRAASPGFDSEFEEVRPFDGDRALRPGGRVREPSVVEPARPPAATRGGEASDPTLPSAPDAVFEAPAEAWSDPPSVEDTHTPDPRVTEDPDSFDETPVSVAPSRVVAPVAAPTREPAPSASPPPSPASFVPEPVQERPAARPKRSGGVAVLPGDLRSGGANDDGRAIRDTSFLLPPLSLLDDHPAIVASTDEAALTEVARRLTQTLREFKIDGRVSAIRPGPVITMYEFEPAAGVKLSSITGLGDNIKMALRAVSVRIVAPLPGKGCVGIEVPNERRQTIWARDVFSASEFTSIERQLPMILGKDTEGRPVVVDLARMPHLMVGGTTGAGKSVGVNAMLCSMLYMRTPEELRMILIDPKMLEFALYEDIPHLLHPVVTDAKFASAVLQWACNEMDDRYRTMARWQTRNVESYNQKVQREMQSWTPEKARLYAPKDWPEGEMLPQPRTFPYIVIVIDELAELMQVASGDVEASISRIAAKARAAGIHLILATQSPRRDVLTGVIKANMPASVAYQVRSGLDSRVILDEMGAETLLGKGDLLYRGPGTSSLTRIHGPFLGEQEVQRIADHLRAQGAPEYDTRIASAASEGAGDDEEIEYDEKYDEAVEFAVSRGSISTSMLQRHLGIGYNRAANIVETMEREGVVGPADGVKPRKVLVAQ